MREILFRGKTLANGEWIYGDLIRDDDDVCILQEGLIWREIIPESVGEYTGLKDKNGTRIFEGDIISAYLDDISPESETRLLVCWNDYGWHGKTKYGYETLESDWVNNYFEVIGNIHDNPELLKGE